MTKKEPLKFQLTEEQLCELVEKQETVEGLRIQSMDIAFNIGRLQKEVWDKIHKLFPESEDVCFSINWRTGELTEVKDC